jgi:hypothetical protein
LDVDWLESAVLFVVVRLSNGGRQKYLESKSLQEGEG